MLPVRAAFMGEAGGLFAVVVAFVFTLNVVVTGGASIVGTVETKPSAPGVSRFRRHSPAAANGSRATLTAARRAISYSAERTFRP